jgi:hypothetical protein
MNPCVSPIPDLEKISNLGFHIDAEMIRRGGYQDVMSVFCIEEGYEFLENERQKTKD